VSRHAGSPYGLLYVLDLPAPRDPVGLALEAVAGGASALQLRGKRCDARELYDLALALGEGLRSRGVPLFINDRLDVALAARADGVHVGEDDLPFERVRELAPGLLLGVSCYGDVALARRAAAAGADYLAFGAFYPSPSKPESEVVPLGVLAEARALGPPIVAIGGVTRERAPETLRAGADGVAVISAIQGAEDPRAAARELRELVDRERVAPDGSRRVGARPSAVGGAEGGEPRGAGAEGTAGPGGALGSRALGTDRKG
jgi:thiamine-phosphate pyrophosphorylase